jgi:hypothetical protein
MGHHRLFKTNETSMADALHVITRERHTHKKWLRPTDYKFAATANIAPVGAAEMVSAARAFPLAFAEVDGSVTLAALFSLQPGRNLFVTLDGRWLASHIPAVFQTYPFNLGRKPDGNFALCINESSGLVRDAAVGDVGFPFFDPDGTPSPETRTIVEALTKAQREIEKIRAAVGTLVARNLLEPWPIVSKDESGERRIGGLRHVNEKALNALGAEDLLALRNSGGLAIAYCQMFSMGNIAVLGTLAGAHERATRQRMEIPQNSFISEDDGNLKIDWSTFLKDD